MATQYFALPLSILHLIVEVELSRLMTWSRTWSALHIVIGLGRLQPAVIAKDMDRIQLHPRLYHNNRTYRDRQKQLARQGIIARSIADEMRT